MRSGKVSKCLSIITAGLEVLLDCSTRIMALKFQERFVIYKWRSSLVAGSGLKILSRKIALD